ncbi:procathepsin L-like [Sitodiplosis mosellana]|uniref:procathepsin L-like n=1 Tax=Sitodiplosis mosellana TaxID=263140 RepID=UPI0024453595|nr:procathepsin L-like [Sitodiplosis mosellana]
MSVVSVVIDTSKPLGLHISRHKSSLQSILFNFQTVMRAIRIVLCFFFLTSCIFADYSNYKENWLKFKKTFNKQYEHSEEETQRFLTFVDNQKKIFKHNLLHSLGTVTYKLKSNQFADLTHKEFLNKYIGDVITYDKRSVIGNVVEKLDAVSLPPFVDWRQNGTVTEVQTQGACQSSYAFSTTAVLESQYQRKTGNLIKFSEQNLIDCTGGKYNNSGCTGGSVATSLQFVLDNHAIDTEASYPYQGSAGNCQLDVVQANVSINSVNHLAPGREWLLQTAIASVGPISVSFDASLESFQFYSSGIYYDFDCSKNGNHFGLAVGYGTENRLGYYIVKNSFGKSWGEDGYIRMARFRNNNCGIASNAVYPSL